MREEKEMHSNRQDLNIKLLSLLNNYPREIISASDFVQRHTLHKKILSMFVEGANPNLQNKYGETFLHLLISYLTQDNIPFWLANLAMDNIEKVITVHHANMTLTNHSGHTPFDILLHGSFYAEHALRLIKLSAHCPKKIEKLIYILMQDENNRDDRNINIIIELQNIQNKLSFEIQKNHCLNILILFALIKATPEHYLNNYVVSLPLPLLIKIIDYMGFDKLDRDKIEDLATAALNQASHIKQLVAKKASICAQKKDGIYMFFTAKKLTPGPDVEPNSQIKSWRNCVLI